MKKRGISLIVLVITIIVMIILAAAIIISLNNTGIIGNANKAKDESDLANIKTAADLIYSDYILDESVLPVGTTVGDYITEKLVNNGTIKGKEVDYYVVVNNKQTYVITVGSTADKYIKGEIKDGDYVDYDPKDGVLDTSKITYTGKWRVIGLTDDCCLKLVSAESTGTYNLLTDTTGEGILKAVSELNEICSVYGKGVGAKYARCIILEDVLKEYQYKNHKFYWQKEGEDVKLVIEYIKRDNEFVKHEFVDKDNSKYSYLKDNKIYESQKPTNLKDGEKLYITQTNTIGNIVQDESKINLIFKDINGANDTNEIIFFSINDGYKKNSFTGQGLICKGSNNGFKVNVLLVYGKGKTYTDSCTVNLRTITILDENTKLQKVEDNHFCIEK